MEERTIKEAFRVVELAKLDPGTLVPQSQALEFVTEDQCMPNLTLMEVTKEIADQLEKGDEEFVFRGEYVFFLNDLYLVNHLHKVHMPFIHIH